MYSRGKIMSEEERHILCKWANDYIISEKIRTNRTPDSTGYHYHLFMKKDDMTIPSLVWEIKSRIESKEEMQGYNESDISLKDLLLIIEPGSGLPKHVDQNKKQFIRARFNVFIQVPRYGCDTYYDNIYVNAKECEYVLCRCGIDEHYCTVNTDTLPRVSLSFGYLLPAEKLDALTVDPAIGTYRYYPLAFPKNS